MIAAKAAPMPEFGSFNPPRMKVETQKPLEFALLLVIAIVLPVAIVVQW